MTSLRLNVTDSIFSTREGVTYDEYDDYRCKPLNLDSKYVVVGSEMGTGKTYQMVYTMKQCMELNKRFLVLSSRRTYAKSVTQRLVEKGIDIKCYLDGKSKESDDIPGYCVSSESLHTIKKKYDVVFVDESTSFLKQMCSKFHGADGLRNKDVFDALVCNSERVFFLDANIDKRTLKMIEHHRKTNEKVHVSLNSFKPNTNLTIEYMSDTDQMIKQLKIQLSSGKNVQIVLGTEAMGIYKIEPILKQMGITYYFHHKSGTDLSNVIENIEVHWATVRVVMYTATVGPGLDFSGEHFHCRFSLGNSNTNSVREFNQMRGRVRYLIDRVDYVLNKTKKMNKLTSIDDIKAKIARDINRANADCDAVCSEADRLIVQGNTKYNCSGDEAVWDIDFTNHYIQLYLDNTQEDNMSANEFDNIFENLAIGSGATTKICELEVTKDELEEIRNDMKEHIQSVMTENYSKYAETEVCDETQLEVLNDRSERGIATKADKVSIRKTIFSNKLTDSSTIDLPMNDLYDKKRTQIDQSIMERDFTLLGCKMVDDLRNKDKEVPITTLSKYIIVHDIVTMLGMKTSRHMDFIIDTNLLTQLMLYFNTSEGIMWLAKASYSYCPNKPYNLPTTHTKAKSIVNHIFTSWGDTKFVVQNKRENSTYILIADEDVSFLIDNMKYEGSLIFEANNPKDLFKSKDLMARCKLSQPIVEIKMEQEVIESKVEVIEPEPKELPINTFIQPDTQPEWINGTGSQAKAFERGDIRKDTVFICKEYSYVKDDETKWTKSYSSFSDHKAYMTMLMNTPDKEKRFYEIIRGECCECYDLDLKMDDWDGTTKDDKVRNVVDAFLERRNDYADITHNTINNLRYTKHDLVVMESCNKVKLSLHITLRPELTGRKKVYFKSMPHQKIFIDPFVAQLAQHYKGKDDNKNKIILDAGIYTKNRLMRLEFSHKNDQYTRNIQLWNESSYNDDFRLGWFSYSGSTVNDTPIAIEIRERVVKTITLKGTTITKGPVDGLAHTYTRNQLLSMIGKVNPNRWKEQNTAWQLVAAALDVGLTTNDVLNHARTWKDHEESWAIKQINGYRKGYNDISRLRSMSCKDMYNFKLK